MSDICVACNSHEGFMLHEFDTEKSYSWADLVGMTECCVSCGTLKENEDDRV